jgi:type I restriction enzyme, R subunit
VEAALVTDFDSMVPGLNEADTCRKLVVPALQAAGWDDEPRSIREQVPFEDIVRYFGGVEALRAAVEELQRLLYAA